MASLASHPIYAAVAAAIQCQASKSLCMAITAAAVRAFQSCSMEHDLFDQEETAEMAGRQTVCNAALQAHQALNMINSIPTHNLGIATKVASDTMKLNHQEKSTLRNLRKKANAARHAWNADHDHSSKVEADPAHNKDKVDKPKKPVTEIGLQCDLVNAPPVCSTAGCQTDATPHFPNIQAAVETEDGTETSDGFVAGSSLGTARDDASSSEDVATPNSDSVMMEAMEQAMETPKVSHAKNVEQKVNAIVNEQETVDSQEKTEKNIANSYVNNTNPFGNPQHIVTDNKLWVRPAQSNSEDKAINVSMGNDVNIQAAAAEHKKVFEEHIEKKDAAISTDFSLHEAHNEVDTQEKTEMINVNSRVPLTNPFGNTQIFVSNNMFGVRPAQGNTEVQVNKAHEAVVSQKKTEKNVAISYVNDTKPLGNPQQSVTNNKHWVRTAQGNSEVEVNKVTWGTRDNYQVAFAEHNKDSEPRTLSMEEQRWEYYRTQRIGQKSSSDNLQATAAEHKKDGGPQALSKEMIDTLAEQMVAALLGQASGNQGSASTTSPAQPGTVRHNHSYQVNANRNGGLDWKRRHRK